MSSPTTTSRCGGRTRRFREVSSLGRLTATPAHGGPLFPLTNSLRSPDRPFAESLPLHLRRASPHAAARGHGRPLRPLRPADAPLRPPGWLQTAFLRRGPVPRRPRDPTQAVSSLWHVRPHPVRRTRAQTQERPADKGSGPGESRRRRGRGSGTPARFRPTTAGQQPSERPARNGRYSRPNRRSQILSPARDQNAHFGGVDAQRAEDGQQLRLLVRQASTDEIDEVGAGGLSHGWWRGWRRGGNTSRVRVSIWIGSGTADGHVAREVCRHAPSRTTRS